MYEDLVKLGFDGSYERIAAFARAWRADRHRAEQTTGQRTFVTLVRQPREAIQFDRSAKHRSFVHAFPVDLSAQDAGNDWYEPIA
ncbi:MAG: hypothetical protein ABJ327_24385 [Litoreibacter sp.]